MIGLAERAARAAAAVIRQGPATRVGHKGAVDLVTDVDLAAEAAIRGLLERESPGVPVLAEEGGGRAGPGTRWIVDPLDGTTNFVHGYPFVGVSIAFEAGGRLEAGVVFDVVRDRCFRATRGGGAWVDGERIAVSSRSSLGGALLASGFGYDRRERAGWYLRFVRAFLEKAGGFRRGGCASMDLAMLASGQLDGFWEFGLHAWDVAAGALLVQEAGGRVTDVGGGPLELDAPRILASNGHIHEQMAAILASLPTPSKG